MTDPTWTEVTLVDNLADDIDTLNGELPDLLDTIAANQPRLCELLYALHEQRIRLAELEATVEAKAARAMGPADRIEWDWYCAERELGASWAATNRLYNLLKARVNESQA